MAKRFTDTEKWNDEWFMELDPALKCFWIYLCDKCDHAGVWKVNFRLASVSIGAIIDKQSALKAFGERVCEISLEKWFIQKFIYFQYPSGLSDNNKAHGGVLKSLLSNNIDSRPYQAPLKLLESSFVGPLRGVQDKDKEMDKDSSVLDLNKKEEEAKKNLPSIQPQDFRNSKDSEIKPDNLIQLFNDECAGKGRISHSRGFSKKTVEDYSITTSYAEFRKLDTWREVFQKTACSPFLTGQQPGSNFVASLNWLVIHDNALKVLSGQYGIADNQNAFKANPEHRKPKQLTDREIQLLKEAGQI